MSTAPVDVSGPWFKGVPIGLELHAPAVTITAGHAAVYQALFCDGLRLPLDPFTSKAVTGHHAPLAHPLLAIAIAISQSNWASQHLKVDLFYRGLRIERPIHLGDTLRTRTRIVGVRQNSTRLGGDAGEGVTLEVTTTNQRGEPVLRFWRCPMNAARDNAASTGIADDLETIGSNTDRKVLAASLPNWKLNAFRATLHSAAPVVPGAWFRIHARDPVTGAPELVRLAMNAAMVHTDSALSHPGEQLVYSGHAISMAFAQVTRALPDLLTIVAWDSCDHTAPVAENDHLRTDVTVLDRIELCSGALLTLHAKGFAARAMQSEVTQVLDWKFSAWTA